MEIKIVDMKERIVLKIIGRLDTLTSDEFQNQVLAQLQDCKTEILLDCGEVEYLSSAGLRSLLIIAKAASRKNIPVVLCSLQHIVREVLEMSGFDSFFEVRHGYDK